MPITAGSLRITRRKNMGDYSHREATVELHYMVEGDEKIGTLGDMARIEALTQVAMANATDVRVDPPVLIELDTELQEKVELKPENVKSEQVEQASKRHRRTKAEMEAARAAEMLPAATTSAMEHRHADPTSTQDAPAPVIAPTSAPVEVVAGEYLGTEISDKELNNACNETMNRIKNKVAIQGVIQRYTDGVVSTIPQAERAKFLTGLKAL